MLRILLLCVLLAFQPGFALAQNWPERPVRIIVPFAAGGGTDAIARVMAKKFSDALGQQFFVENRPGASGLVGTQAAAKADPDGYTLLISDANIASNRNLDALADLTPVTQLAWTPLVLAAHPSLQCTTLAELLQLAQTRPVDYSTPGIGSPHHLTGEYINKVQSTKLTHVPYRGAGPAVTDAVGGQVNLTISGMPPVVPFLQSGGLKAIAVTSKRRSPTFAAIPSMAETKGFEEFDITNWYGLFARSAVSSIVLERLQKASAEALKDPQVRKIFTTQAAEPVGSTRSEFGDFFRGEVDKYSKLAGSIELKNQ